MAFKYREELVGKRFLSVCANTKLKLTKILDWSWRAGIIRAATYKDPKHPDLSVLVEFDDDRDWKRREWIRVYQDNFQVFLVEHTLVWASRQECPLPNANVKNLYWPSVNFKPLVDEVGLFDHRYKPIEYLVDRRLDVLDYANLRVYQESDGENQPASRDYAEVKKAIRQWTEYQDGQRILLTTPSVLVGLRVEVYRTEGTTQWYTAVIGSYNENTKELTLTDDTVLEEHYEDPCLVQMKLIGDGVVESILKGENIGITPRRRSCNLNNQNQSGHYTRTRTQTPVLSNSRITAAALAKKSRTPNATARPGNEAKEDSSGETIGAGHLDKKQRSSVGEDKKKKVKLEEKHSKIKVENASDVNSEVNTHSSLVIKTAKKSSKVQNSSEDSGDSQHSSEDSRKSFQSLIAEIPESKPEPKEIAKSQPSPPHKTVPSPIQESAKNSVISKSPRTVLQSADSVSPRLSEVNRTNQISEVHVSSDKPVAEVNQNNFSAINKPEDSVIRTNISVINSSQSTFVKKGLPTSESVKDNCVSSVQRCSPDLNQSKVTSSVKYSEIPTPVNEKHTAVAEIHAKTSASRSTPSHSSHNHEQIPRKSDDFASDRIHPLTVEKNETVHVYRDPNLVTNSSRNIHHIDSRIHGLMHPTGLSHSTPVVYPRIPALPQHTRAPNTPLAHSHIPAYGLSSPHLIHSRHGTTTTAPTPSNAAHLEQHHLHPQAYRHLLTPGAMMHPQYGAPVGMDVLWQQKYSQLGAPPQHPWVMAQYHEELRKEEIRIVQERQSRMERERKEEHDKKEREKIERVELEKEREMHKNHEKQDLSRSKQEQAQREAVQQHFEESFRLASQKKQGWSPISSLPLSKTSAAMPIGRNSPITMAAFSRASEEKLESDSRDRYNNPDVRAKQDQERERWLAVVGSQNAVQRVPEAADYTPARSSSVHSFPNEPGSAKTTHSSQSNSHYLNSLKSAASPALATPTVIAGQGRSEPSFSLYGYQPFKHSYITPSQASQLKAREESLESNVQGVRPAFPTEDMGRSNSVLHKPSSPSPKQGKLLHPGVPERASPLYNPVHGGGAFKPYEYVSNSPAPAHQKGSSPTLSRVGTPHHAPVALMPMDQPQNLVKGETKTAHSPPTHTTPSKFEQVKPSSGYPPPPRTTQAHSGSPHSYNLIQQGLVPNPIYTPATAVTTSNISAAAPSITVSSKSMTRVPSPTQSRQQYPKANPGVGIVSGTPVCRSNNVPYTEHQRSSQQYTPFFTSGLIQRNSTPNPPSEISSSLGGRLAPSLTPSRGRISSPSPAHANPGPPVLVQNEAFNMENKVSPPRPSSTPGSQMQPLNLQNSHGSNVLKRRSGNDMDVRKKVRCEDAGLQKVNTPPFPTAYSSPPGIPLSSSISPAVSRTSPPSNSAPPTLTPSIPKSTSPANSDHSRDPGLYYGKHHKGRFRGETPPLLTGEKEEPKPPNPSSSALPFTVTNVASHSAATEHEAETRVTPSPALSTCTIKSNSSATSGSSSTNHTKLKKAWLQRHSDEDKINSTKNDCDDASTKTVNSIADSKSSSTPGSTTSVHEERKAKDSTPIKEEKRQEEDSTSSSSEAENELSSSRNKPKPAKKRPVPTKQETSPSKKLRGESKNGDNNHSNGNKNEDDKKTKTKQAEKENSSAKKRGRKPKGKGNSGNGNSSSDDANKKKPNKLFEKPPVSRLKKTGDPFLQDGSCCDVAPKLPKCRECRMTPLQKSKKAQPNIFCRFYAFRKLRYGKNGILISAGFSEPGDATDDDLKLWLPPIDSPPQDLDVETSKFLLAHVGDQFCDLVSQEKEAQSLHIGEVKTLTWKRVVQGIREMCDVCETTLFNIHWVCEKCGFVVCIDCYKARKNGNIKEEECPPKDRDEFQWLLCNQRQPHEQSNLMITQIIAGNALWDLGKIMHDVREKKNISAFCPCYKCDSENDGKKPVNGLCKQLMSAVSKCFSTDNHALNGLSTAARNKKNAKENVNGTVTGHLNKEDALAAYSSESGGSPLSWLADVALNQSGKLQDDQGSNKNHLEDEGANEGHLDDDKNFSTLRELLIRPTGKGNGNSNHIKKALTSTLDEVISQVIEERVGKIEKREQEKEKDDKQLMHFARRYPQVKRGRDLLPIRVCTLNESSLMYPNVSHAWLCNGKLLLLTNPSNENNLEIFQEQWKRGQPIVVADVNKRLDMTLWTPDGFCRDFGEEKNDLVNCKTGNVLPNIPMRRFWEGFETFSKRMKDDDDEYMLLKLKDWPPGEDFSELLPSRFKDLMKNLPLYQYTHRDGVLNIAGRLPETFVRPDLGPKMYNAYGSALYPTKGTTNLHLDISDAVNVMVYVGIPKDGNDEEHIQEALKAIDNGGCDALMRKRVREKGVKPGALWHIYNARDADKIRDLLNKVAEETGEKPEAHHDPIHDQSWYLDGVLRERLYKEYGVEGYAIAQCLGDAVFIPAGAPHQVRNLHSCVKVAEDFVSPENIAHCFSLTQEFRHLSDTHTNHEDKLQIKNIIYHCVKDALALLCSGDMDILKNR